MSMHDGEVADAATEAELECVVFRVERRQGAYLYVLGNDQVVSDAEAVSETEAVSEAEATGDAKAISDVEPVSDVAAAEAGAASVLDGLPDTLLVTLGPLTEVMALQLGPSRKLVAADVVEVMRQLREQGYYLQMPPAQLSGRSHR
ncbi:MAG: YcgL domain-containing protein [Gammaproteobacteria bacterium]|nr:YcgL domain-containing protein [Gammaproteobacteria bacterium]MBT8151018.1 YcgL domain-containing protein [Gammaproteobacteria bacterium]NND40143.1 hypothetical protein [Pseudomonadales bacterium]NNM12165.1 hypothetical protein [Pseudomonadales bacterium]RZV58884.1 MAG: hypothetical protein EX270_02120 [Pseudomonadales bacterium]